MDILIKYGIIIFLLVTIQSCFSTPNDNIELEQELIKGETPVQDYGKVFSSKKDYHIYFPKSEEETSALVQFAKDNNHSIRIRGKGHSMNGNSLPNNNEIWLRTDSLNFYSFSKEKTINVGAGVRIHDVLPLLHELGHTLPSIPGGGTGITVGGFISAGGFDRNLEEWRRPYGGFWENVLSITLIDGQGDIRRIKKDDYIFQYVFGAMGQLGVIVDAELKIVPDPDKTKKPYPSGATGKILDGLYERTYPNDNDVLVGKSFESMFWFSYFGNNEEAIRKDLEELRMFHAEKTESIVRYNMICMNIPHINFQPPLVYPKSEPFIGCAFQVFHQQRAESENDIINEMYLIAKKKAKTKAYARYLQAEYVPKNHQEYKDYFEPNIYESFLNLKNKIDPDHIFNPNSIFPKD